MAAYPATPTNHALVRAAAVSSAWISRNYRLLAFGGALVEAAWLAGGQALSAIAQWSGYRLDFTAFYTAAHMIANGSGQDIYNTRAMTDAQIALVGHPVGGAGMLGYYNPPFFALLMTPLSVLSIERAYQVWTAFNVALLLLNVWMLWRTSRQLPRAWRLALCLAFVTFFPIIYGVLLGQFSLIPITARAGAFLLRAGHERWAGVALAPLLIKPELLLPVALFLLLKRRWRVFQTLAPLTALAMVASVIVIGPSNSPGYPAYLLSSASAQDAGAAYNVMFNWSGIVTLRDQSATAPPAAIAVVLLSGVTLAGAWHAWRGAIDPRSPRFAVQWAVLSLATVLVDPHLYLQDTALLALPAVALLAATPPGNRRGMVAALLAGWALLSVGVYPNEHLGVNLFGIYIAAGGTALVYWAMRTGRPDAPFEPRFAGPVRIAARG